MVEDVGRQLTDVITLAEGPIRGLVADGMQRFLGIPYAAAPVGDLRWRPPNPPAAWDEPLDAFAFGSVCAQDADASFPGFGYVSDTEDCLYLNVFTPASGAAGHNLPVMFWIPGGGLFMGGSSDYDPSALVREGVVFVSINYRVSIFGFFSHPVINAEGHAAGNYGIMDQQFALDWVRRNIAKFGRDPANVTIFGESAGGISVLSHLASSGSADLFHKAILQSCSVAATKSTWARPWPRQRAARSRRPTT